MLKALVGRPGAKPLLILGLTDENIARLFDDKPILFDATPFGYPADITIITGHTIADLHAKLFQVGVEMPDPPFDDDEH